MTDIFFLAHKVGEQMLERLQFMTLQPKHILVAGVEGKFFAELLKKHYPDAEILVDLDEKKILTLKEHSVDLIFANLFLPWCKEFKKTFFLWRHLLQTEGVLMFSSFGPDTLIELRENYANNLLPDLIDMHNIGDELIQARFADPVLDVEYLTVTYRDLKKLLMELQATKMLTEGLTEINLEPNAKGAFSLTYEIVYGHAFGPDIEVDHIADEEGIVKIPLSHLRRK